MNDHDSPPPETLMQRRKDEIYAVLRVELRRRTRRRRAARGAAAAGAVCIAAAAALLLRTAAPSTSGTPPAPELPIAHAPPPAPPDAPPPTPPHRVAVIRTDPDILTRLAVHPPEVSLVRRIDDTELLVALDEAEGERFGLIRTGTQIAIVCQTCVSGDHAGPAWMEELRRDWSDRVHDGPANPDRDRPASPL